MKVMTVLDVHPDDPAEEVRRKFVEACRREGLVPSACTPEEMVKRLGNVRLSKQYARNGGKPTHHGVRSALTGVDPLMYAATLGYKNNAYGFLAPPAQR